MTTKDFCEKYATQRKGTGTEKWDALTETFGEDNLLALWVADMEFKAPEAVVQALQERVNHGVYGYSLLPAGYGETVAKWHKNRHAVSIEPAWLRHTHGVVTALYQLVNAFTKPGDAVLIQTPVYGPFFSSVKDTGRKLVECPLQNKQGVYSMDLARVEQLFCQQDIKMTIFCSPHNPAGHVWALPELEAFLALCEKYNVLVVSDEIHQDLIIGKNKQVPAFAVANGAYNNRLLCITSASKTFNLAGLIHSHLLIADEELRKTYDAYAATVSHSALNIMGCVATQAAYQYGEEWLDALLLVVRQNYMALQAVFQTALPKAVISPLEGTYLMWVDLRPYFGQDETAVKAFLQTKCRLAVNYGSWFGKEYAGFVRFNLGTPPENIQKAAQAIAREAAFIK